MSFRSTIRKVAMILAWPGLVSCLSAQQTPVPTSQHFTQIVNPYQTQMALTPNPSSAPSGSTIAFAAALTKVNSSTAVGPTGSITFTLTPTNGPVTTVVQPIQSGAATWSIAPPNGLNTVVASYAGDQNYAAALSQTTATITTPSSPDFDFTLPVVTVQRGQTFNGNITVQPLNGFTGNVSFTNGDLPERVTFSFPTASLKVAANMSPSTLSQTVQFVIGTQATTVTTMSSLLLLGAFGLRRRWRRVYVVLALISACALTVIVGCAGNRFLQSDGTPVGTYTIPITGTSGNLTHTHNMTLIVTNN